MQPKKVRLGFDEIVRKIGLLPHARHTKIPDLNAYPLARWVQSDVKHGVQRLRNLGHEGCSSNRTARAILDCFQPLLSAARRLSCFYSCNLNSNLVSQSVRNL